MFKTYIDQIRMFEEKRKYIYGAGKAGQLIYSLLAEHNLDLDGFCVTNGIGNPKSICGKEVVTFETLSDDLENILILIGVTGEAGKELRENLKYKGVKNLIDIPKEILSYNSWEYNRIKRPTLEITPVIGCKVNCKYCPQDILLHRYFENDKERKNILSPDDYKYILQKIPKDTLIEFSGFVEPFMHDRVIEMMEYTNKIGFEMTLFTTLVGLTMEKFQRLKVLDFAKITLHVPDIEQNAYIPLTKEYYKVLEAMLDAKRKDGQPFVAVASSQGTPHPIVAEMCQKRNVYIRTELTDRVGNLDEQSENLIHTRKRSPIVCLRSTYLNHNVLLPDGSVVLCCNDFGMKHVLGNLFTDDYESIIQSAEAKRIELAMGLDTEIEIICHKCIDAREL